MAAAGFVAIAAADGGESTRRTPVLPKYKQECASCHTAFPPGMLPAASWRNIMTSLPTHYGTDASLDPATTKELSAWLVNNAATVRRVNEVPPENRITRSAWFTRKHREVSAATWKLPLVKTATNCAACHPQADQGDFNERSIRIPR
jgi:mono/diheme cytochrome c family protein